MGEEDVIHRNLPRRADRSPRRRLGALPPRPLQPARPARQPGAGRGRRRPGHEAQFRRWAGLGPDVAPENTPGCFLAFCGVVGLGAIMARGRVGARLPGMMPRRGRPTPSGTIRARGNPAPTDVAHPRVRPALAHPRGGGDGVAALGRGGHGRPAGRDDGLGGRQPIGAARGRRGAVRAAPVDACGARGRRPRDPGRDHGVHPADHRPQGDAFKTLRQGLGYCWSVAVAALPERAGR